VSARKDRRTLRSKIFFQNRRKKEKKKLISARISAFDTYKLSRTNNASIVRHAIGFVGALSIKSGGARRQIKCEFD